MALKKSDIRAIISNEDSSKDEKISALLDLMHTETDAIKDDMDELKSKIASLEKENKELAKGAKSDDGDDWKEKYEAEKKAFADYKKEQSDKENKAALDSAYSKLLKDEGVSEKAIELILKTTDLSKEKIKDGEFENKDVMIKAIKEKYSDFIQKSEQKGAKTSTPPKNDGGKLTKDDIYKKDERGHYILSAAERQKAIAENIESFTNNAQ